MKNELIKQSLRENGIKQWELAEFMNVSEATLCRKFRKSFSEQEQKYYVELIAQMAERKVK